MNDNNQNLNVGEPHLDGKGEYVPPAGGQSAKEAKSVEKADIHIGDAPQVPEETPESDTVAQNQEEASLEKAENRSQVHGQDYHVGGNEEIDESGIELPVDGVEYSAPKPPGDDVDSLVGKITPMDEIADGTDSEVVEKNGPSLEDAVAEPDQKNIPVIKEIGVKTGLPTPGQHTEEKMPEGKTSINMDNVVEKQKLTQSNKPGFDSQSVQDARSDQQQEGGVARNRTTGNQFHSGGKLEGSQIMPNPAPPDYSQMYEMTGFTVSFEKVKGQGNVNVEICDHFPDIETAHASINGDKYLMPMPQVGFKVVEIVSGAPTIGFQDRVLYEYINDKWRRK